MIREPQADFGSASYGTGPGRTSYSAEASLQEDNTSKFIIRQQKSPQSERLEIRDAPITIECVICASSNQDVSFPKDSPTPSCSHAPEVCLDCLKRTIHVAIAGGDCLTGIRCPSLGCSQRLEYFDIEKWADKEAFTRYDKLLLQNSLRTDENYVWCLNPRCQAGQEHAGGEDNYIITCFACGTKQCARHQIVWHEGYTCAQWDQRLQTMQLNENLSENWIQTETKACPGRNCGRRIFKVEGCDHMTCRPPAGCNHQFCWECLAPWATIVTNDNSSHFDHCRYYTGQPGANPAPRSTRLSSVPTRPDPSRQRPPANPRTVSFLNTTGPPQTLIVRARNRFPPPNNPFRQALDNTSGHSGPTLLQNMHRAGGLVYVGRHGVRFANHVEQIQPVSSTSLLDPRRVAEQVRGLNERRSPVTANARDVRFPPSPITRPLPNLPPPLPLAGNNTRMDRDGRTEAQRIANHFRQNDTSINTLSQSPPPPRPLTMATQSSLSADVLAERRYARFFPGTADWETSFQSTSRQAESSGFIQPTAGSSSLRTRVEVSQPSTFTLRAHSMASEQPTAMQRPTSFPQPSSPNGRELMLNRLRETRSPIQATRPNPSLTSPLDQLSRHIHQQMSIGRSTSLSFPIVENN